jgi:hypothetical protein
MVGELQHELNLSHKTFINIVQHLEFNKVCAHWVPQAPTEDHKKQ